MAEKDFEVTESNSLIRKKLAEKLKLFISQKETKMDLKFESHPVFTYSVDTNFDSFRIYEKGTKFKEQKKKIVRMFFFFKKEEIETIELYPQKIAYLVVNYNKKEITNGEIKIYGKENISRIKDFASDFLNKFNVKLELILEKE